jgi:hypothetical protein
MSALTALLPIGRGDQKIACGTIAVISQSADIFRSASKAVIEAGRPLESKLTRVECGNNVGTSS